MCKAPDYCESAPYLTGLCADRTRAKPCSRAWRVGGCASATALSWSNGYPVCAAPSTKRSKARAARRMELDTNRAGLLVTVAVMEGFSPAR